MNFGWSWEWPILGLIVSSCGELEVSSGTWMGLLGWLDAESEKEDERSGVGDTILRACAMVFFFFFAA